MVLSAVFLVLSGAALPAQQIDLGPAPTAASEPAPIIDNGRRAPANWYDTSTRATVRDLYNSVLAPTNSVAMGQTGQVVSSCQAGETSETWKNAVLARINWFRGLAGIPMGVTLDATLNSKDQQAALMMSANKALSHSPPPEWLCYTAAGAEAAGSSNICYLSGYGFSDPGCVAGYVVDSGSNNAAVGHRRWLLYPKRTTFGTGDIAESGGYPRTNAIWVFGAQSANRETRDNFVAWPPKGYFPYQLLPGRWSFSYPSADFSQATVTMTRDGANVPVTLETIANGYGENTLVWLPTMSTGNPANDSTINVTLNNVRISGVPQSFSYQVIVFDPAVGGGSPTTVNITVASNPAGRNVIVDGTTYQAPKTFEWTPGSTHSLNTESTQTSEGTRYVFANWSQGGGQSQTITVPSSSTTYTANYTTQYRLTTTVSPSASGAVSKSPFGADGWYNSGTSVQLTASAESGYQFSQWSGGASGSTNPVNVTMNAPRTVTATFSAVASEASVTVNSSPAGRTIIVDGTSYTAPHTFGWSAGTSHSLNALSSDGVGSTRYVFANWSQGGGQQQSIVAQAGSSTFTANYTVQYQLTTSVLPAGAGTVTRSPSSEGWYNSGTSVQLTASANGGHQFQSWTGDVTGSTTNPTTILMNGPRSVTANFSTAEVPQCTYALDKAAASVSPLGALGDFRLLTQNGCPWSVTSNANWVSITSALSGTGEATVRYSVAANPTTQPRSATITAAGKTFRIEQPGASCSFTLAPQSQTVPSSGGGFSLTVTTTPGCTWTAAALPEWVTLTTGSGPYTGPRTLGYTVPANNSPAPRTGTITVGSMVLQILQQGAGVSQIFNDVGPGHPFFDYITLLGTNGISGGCGSGNYCADATTTRGEMAVFVIRSLLGTGTFSYPQAPYFTDVDSSHPFFAYVQKLRELGITTGCSATEYCANANVTREQMAVFLVRALLGISSGDAFPFPQGSFFNDIPSTHPFYSSIQKMKEFGITTGCTASEYCGGALTTRGQMAVFLIRAFLAP